MNIQSIRAVIFDMDGVITDSMRYHCRAWQRVLQRHGLDIPQQEIYQREGQKGIDSLREFFSYHNKPFTLELAERILIEKEVLFKEIVKPYFIRGARSFLNGLHRRGYDLALVTGTARHEVIKMLPKHLLEKFNVVVTGSDVNNGKPHPEPYLTAISALNHQEDNCVVIENAPFGIRSAKQAGLRCLALETSLPASYLQEADYVFESYTKLKTTLDFFNHENKKRPDCS